MFPNLKRAFKMFRGDPITAEDYELLWARTAEIVEESANRQNTHSLVGFSMPEQRICATQVAKGKWDVYPEQKTTPPPFAAPLTLSFGYEASGAAIARNIPTGEMVRILRANDPHSVFLPDHISMVCK